MKSVISLLIIFLNFLFSGKTSAQAVGIGTQTPDVSAIFDVQSGNKGVLFPRLSTAGRMALNTTTSGLLVYDSSSKHFFYYDGTSPYNVSGWKMIITSDDLAILEGNVAGYDVFLVAGQSNTHAGKAFDPVLDQPDSDIKQLGRFDSLNYRIVAAAENLQHWTRVDGYIGFALTFAKLYKPLLAGTGRKILIVPCGYGNTAVIEWQRGGMLYNDIIARINYATSLPGSRLAGILWHQGENDLENGNYQSQLDTLITNIREDLGNTMLPFVLGGLVPFVVNNPWRPNRILIQNIIKDTPNRLLKTAYADPSLPTIIDKPDNEFDESHFDAAGQREMGKRYFGAYMLIR